MDMSYMNAINQHFQNESVARLHPGTICIVNFGVEWQFRGEFWKTRPAIVLFETPDGANKITVTVVPMTTKEDPERGPTSVLIRRTPHNRLMRDGIAVAHHLRAVTGHQIVRPIGRIDARTFAEVQAAVARSVGLPFLFQTSDRHYAN